MAKIIKLDRNQRSHWRRNEIKLVVDNGTLVGSIVRNITPQEQDALTKLSARHSRIQDGDKTYCFDPPTLDERGNQKTLSRRYIISEGKELHPVTTRDLIAKQLYSDHGPVQIRASSGQILKQVTMPGDRIPFTQSQQALPPANCVCTSYQNREEGKHHYACPYNLLAPVSEQGVNPNADNDQTSAQEFHDAFGTVQNPAETGNVAQSVSVPAVVKVPSPEECACIEYAGVQEGEHHDMCVHRDAWEKQEALVSSAQLQLPLPESVEPSEPAPPTPPSEPDTTMVLMSPTGGPELREATEEEIEESEASCEETGMPLIAVDGVGYAVLPRETVKLVEEGK